ncbi:fimbrial protein [Providencia huaxiensis]|uniref:fimbrial protein n=1 Tax=Providencia huaxiensis TaxID=2027290 RepID=UPI003D287CD5
MKLIHSYLFFAYFFCYSANAADVQVQINGSILSQSCNVKSTDLTKNVIFNDLNLGEFPYTGSVSEPEEVNIRLENCTGNVEQIYYIFSGEQDLNAPNLLKITGQSGSSYDDLAKGIAIEILDENKKAVPLNEKINLNKAITEKTYDFKFFLRYKSTSPTVTSGDASSLLYLDFYYE